MPAMASKSRSSCSSGSSYSTASRAIRQSCGLRGVTPAQRQRTYSAPASAWVVPPGAGSNIDSAAKRWRSSASAWGERALQQLLQDHRRDAGIALVEQRGRGRGAAPKSTASR